MCKYVSNILLTCNVDKLEKFIGYVVAYSKNFNIKVFNMRSVNIFRKYSQSSSRISEDRDWCVLDK